MRWLFFLLALISSASGQSLLIRKVLDPKTDTHVEVTAMFSTLPTRGYVPVRVKMVNRLEESRNVNLAFESVAGSHFFSKEGARMASSFSFTAPGEKTTEHEILVPLVTVVNMNYGGNPTLSVTLGGGFGSEQGSMGAGISDPTQPVVLMSEPLFTPNASSLDVAAATSGRRYGGGSFAGKFEAKMMPSDWRAYSGYDTILMTEADWTAAGSGPQSALIAWVRLGGHLIVYSQGGTAASLGLPADASFGKIEVQPLATGNTLDAAKTVALVAAGQPSGTQAEGVMNDFSTTWPLQNLFGKAGFQAGLFIFILIAFGVVVGPVNLFVFAKAGRRHRLFITTPLIALGASLILIVLIIFQDGFGGRGVRQVLMEVRPDNNENAAYVHQEQFSRTGVLTGASFTLEDQAALSPVPIDADNRWARLTNQNAGGGTSFEASFVDGKLKTSGDWFQSRSEQGHILDAVVPTRGRIERTAAAGNPQMVSTFDFPIEKLLYLDKSSQWWMAENVQPGSKFSPVTVSASQAKALCDAEQGRFGPRNKAMFLRVWSRPGCFVAVVPEGPGVATYKSVKWQQTRVLLTGPVVNP